jgi:hypothetical protein
VVPEAETWDSQLDQLAVAVVVVAYHGTRSYRRPVLLALRAVAVVVVAVVGPVNPVRGLCDVVRSHPYHLENGWPCDSLGSSFSFFIFLFYPCLEVLASINQPISQM